MFAIATGEENVYVYTRKGESEPPHGQCSIPRKGSAAGESEPPHVYGKTSRWIIVRNPIYIPLIDSGRRVLEPSMVGFTIFFCKFIMKFALREKKSNKSHMLKNKEEVCYTSLNYCYCQMMD